MRLRTYLLLMVVLTVPPVLAAVGVLTGVPAAGRRDANWGYVLGIWAVLAPALAAGIQRLLMPDFVLILPHSHSSNPHEASAVAGRMMKRFLGAAILLLTPLYLRLCWASGWEKAAADWHYRSGRSLIGHALAATAVECWPFVLLALCAVPWASARSVIRTRELDLYWEAKSRTL